MPRKAIAMELDTIYNMDCLKGMKDIPDGSIDMVLCDLPYGTTCNAWDVRLPLDELWAHYKRVAKKNAAIVLFSQMPFGAELIMHNRKMFRYEWIWEKNTRCGFLNARKMPLRTHENILVFYSSLPTYHPQKWQSHPYVREHLASSMSTNYGKKKDCITFNEDGSRYPLDVIKIGTEKKILGGG